MKTCPKCGTQNRQESATCCNCYSSLDSGTTARSNQKPPAARKIETSRPANVKKSGGGGKLVAFLLVIVLLVGAGYGGYWFFLRPTPEKAIKQLVTALEKEDIEGAMTYLSSDTLAFLESTGLPSLIRQATQKAKQQAGNQTAPKSGEDIKLVINSCTYTDPDHASVAVTTDVTIPANPMVPMMSQPQNKSVPMTIPMVREESKWKVDGMKAIDDGMHSLTNENIKQFAQGIKLAEKNKAMFAMMAPGLNIDPVANLVNTELKRRNIDPKSIKPLNIQMPPGMNMPK